MISCIIPIYRAKEFLAECLESVLASEYRDFEILAVLNGEDDGSAAIAQAYSRADARVRVMNSRKGVSAARNTGLSNALGEYVCFLDADDTAEPGWMGALFQAIESSGADVSAIAYREASFDEHGRISRAAYYYFEREGLMTIRDFMLEINGKYAEQRMNFMSLWTKLYRTSIIRRYGLAFDERYGINEDSLFVVRYLSRCRSVATVNRPLMTYRHTLGESASTRYHGGIFPVYHDVASTILDMVNAQTPFYGHGERGAILHMVASFIIGGMVRLCRYDASIGEDEIKEQLRRFCALPYLAELFAAYTPAPGQSVEIPALALAGNIHALFKNCRAKSADKFPAKTQ